MYITVKLTGGYVAGNSRTQQQDLSDSAARIAELELVGGRVCLDFVNTVDPRVGGKPQDYLASYADLVRWAEHAHLLAPDQVATLLDTAARRPKDAQAIFERAITLREILYRLFSAIAARKLPDPADLAAMQAAYVESQAKASLVPASGGLAWRWPTGTDALDQVLWPIVRSAIELATSSEVRRVKECPGLGDCGWLFVDTSKSGRRRWCSMESCGSRAKMRTYYARTHGRPAAPQQNSPVDS
jgi:predicted RNA-binding Zn ribbon-like protein